MIVARYTGIFSYLMTTQVGDAYEPSVANDSYGAALSGYIALIATMAALLGSRLTEQAASHRSFVLLGACIVTALFLAAVPYRLLSQNEAEEVGFPVSSTNIERAFVLDFGYHNADSIPLYIPGRSVLVISRTVEKSLKSWRPSPTDGVDLDTMPRRRCEIFGHPSCRGTN
jgi:hypothetical protein